MFGPTIGNDQGADLCCHGNDICAMRARSLIAYRLVCLSVCMLPMAGRTVGPIKTKFGIRTHVDPRSVLVKVKVIYLCVRYNRIHDSDTWRTTVKHAQ